MNVKPRKLKVFTEPAPVALVRRKATKLDQVGLFQMN